MEVQPPVKWGYDPVWESGKASWKKGCLRRDVKAACETPKARGRRRVFQAKETVQGAIAGGSGGGWCEMRLEKPTRHAGPPRPWGGLLSSI